MLGQTQLFADTLQFCPAGHVIHYLLRVFQIEGVAQAIHVLLIVKYGFSEGHLHFNKLLSNISPFGQVWQVLVLEFQKFGVSQLTHLLSKLM